MYHIFSGGDVDPPLVDPVLVVMCIFSGGDVDSSLFLLELLFLVGKKIKF